MTSSSVLPLHLVDQVLLYAQGLLENLLALMGQKSLDLLEHPLEREIMIQFADWIWWVQNKTPTS